jgi:hypothetical protein
MQAAKAALDEGRPARTVDVSDEDAKGWKMLQLLTAKPVLYVCNVAEDEAATGNAQSARVAEMAEAQGAASRGDLGQDRGRDRAARSGGGRDVPHGTGLDEAGLDRMIRAGYALLQPETYFTVGPKGGARLDDPDGHAGAAGRRASSTAISNAASSGPRRFPTTISSPRRRTGRQGRGQDAGRGQGLRGEGRRRPALPVQRLNCPCFSA